MFSIAWKMPSQLPVMICFACSLPCEYKCKENGGGFRQRPTCRVSRTTSPCITVACLEIAFPLCHCSTYVQQILYHVAGIGNNNGGLITAIA